MNQGKLSEEVEKLRAEIDELRNTLNIQNTDTDVAGKGRALLDAYLDDKPFDRRSFAYIEVKKAFLNAAFETHDLEIIACCLFLIKQTLSEGAFNELLDSHPQYREKYEKLTKPNTLTRFNRREDPSDLVETLKNELKVTKSDLMKTVLKDEIERIEKKSDAVGVEEVDEKWHRLSSLRASKQYMGFDANYFTSCGLIRKWAKGVNPMHAAIIAKYWGMPPEVVRALAERTKDNKDKEELVARGILPKVV